MNKRQRIIIIGGTLLVALSGLFPPYEGELSREGVNPRMYMGYHFLFAPPSERDVCAALQGETPDSTVSTRSFALFSSQIILSRVWLQVLTVVAATLGLFVLFAERRKEPSNNPDASDS